MSPLTAKFHSSNLCVFCRLQNEQSKPPRLDQTEQEKSYSKDLEKGVATKFEIS